MDTVDAVVIGAGLVGLAVSPAFARRGIETVALERSHAIGTETSSRNREVIHAGIYYATGSPQARLCVQGARDSTGLANRTASNTGAAASCSWS